MARERRYARFKSEDVWATLYQDQAVLDCEVLEGTVQGNCVFVRRRSSGQLYKAIVLARSSDWYHYSLNCTERWKHDIQAVIVGTHDSCLDRPVLSIDNAHWYDPKELRIRSLKVVKTDERGRAADDFDQFRRHVYGHNMLIGAVLQGREDALERLQHLPASTRLRIEAKVKRLKLRRQGKPLNVGETATPDEPTDTTTP